MGIHRQIVEFAEAGRDCAVALILKAEGSTPREAGVKAIIEATGKIHGTLGGGAVEAEAQRRAVEACRSGHPAVFDIELEGASAQGDQPICGGAMRILADPTAAKDRACYAQVAEAVDQRRRGALLTIVRTEAEVQVDVQWVPEEATEGLPHAETIRSCLEDGEARLMVEGGEGVEVLVEPVIPEPLLLIVGGGHIGQALARQAVLIGFDVTVIDDRPEFTDPSLFPEGVRTRCGEVAAELAACPIAEDTYIVLVTRGHRHDTEALAACIHAPAAYIGMIGSKRKVALVRRQFLESGLATEEELDRVFAPIGLDIGAETVPEIATSIAAQLVAVRRKSGPYTPPGDMVLR
ncbi:MAG: XdhC family protein [Armatimonadota bacterium]